MFTIFSSVLMNNEWIISCSLINNFALLLSAIGLIIPRWDSNIQCIHLSILLIHCKNKPHLSQLILKFVSPLKHKTPTFKAYSLQQDDAISLWTQKFYLFISTQCTCFLKPQQFSLMMALLLSLLQYFLVVGVTSVQSLNDLHLFEGGTSLFYHYIVFCLTIVHIFSWFQTVNSSYLGGRSVENKSQTCR